MDLKFDNSMIGKLYLENSKNGIPAFRIISGYDYLSSKYISKYIPFIFDSYSLVEIDEKLYLYSLEDAIDLFDKNIKNYTEKLNKIKDIFNSLNIINFSYNRYLEFSYLFNRYIEISNQSKIMGELLSNAKKQSESKEIKLYSYEFNKTQKALRKINRRLNHFFGNDVDLIKKLIWENPYCKTLTEMMNKFENRINRIESEKSRFTSSYNAIKKTMNENTEV